MIERIVTALKTNQNLYMAWDKAKKAGNYKWLVFPFHAIIPVAKILCGRGHDYVGKLKADNYVLKLDGSGLEKENIVFYLPNFERDYIQSVMMFTRNFFERDELAYLKEKYIKSGAVCLDVGANIGNHAVYYSKLCHASRVYAFEPVHSTFEILKKNIAINDLDKIVDAYNLGISDRTKTARITHFEECNIGYTQLAEDETGPLQLVSLDEMKLPRPIDFIKIDVEGMEYDVLCGASSLLRNSSPTIFIEIWEENYEKVDELLRNTGYSMVEKRPAENYIYQRCNAS